MSTRRRRQGGLYVAAKLGTDRVRQKDQRYRAGQWIGISALEFSKIFLAAPITILGIRNNSPLDDSHPRLAHQGELG